MASECPASGHLGGRAAGCRGIWASGRWVAGQMELVVVRWVAYGEASGCPGIGVVEWLVRWNAASGQLGGWARRAALVALVAGRMGQQEAGGRGKGAGGRTPYLKAGASNKDVLYLVASNFGTN